MDLFSLVASLTLDPKEYENELKKAERKASSARVDVDGKVQLTDEYSATLERAERAAETFDGDVDGTISATDEYSGAIDEATEKGEEFDPDASDTIEGTDEYSEAIGAAEASAEGFNPEAEGVITGVDDYTPALDGAASAAQSFDPEAEGDITANDEYSETLGTAETDAANAQLDAHGDITGDSYDFQQAIGDATESADGFEEHFSDVISGLSSALTAAGIVAGINAISSAFSEAISVTAGYADEVDKGAQRMSISRASYQQWRYVLGQNGASINTLTRGWMNLRNALGEAGEASDDAQAAFDALGIDPSQFTDTEDLFNTVIDALAQMSEGSERDTLVTALFGRGGTQLNAMLNTGVQGIRELQDEATELGLIMSDEDIANGVAYGDAVSAMNQAVNALKANIVSGLFPILTDAARMVAGLIGWLNGNGEELTLGDQFAEIEETMNSAFTTAARDESRAQSLADTLRQMSDDTGACKDNLELWQGVANELITLCPTLADQIDIVNGKINEQNGSLEEGIEAWYNNVRAQAVAQSVQAKQNALAQASTNLVDLQVQQEVARADEAANLLALQNAAINYAQRANEVYGRDSGWTEDYIRSFTSSDALLEALRSGDNNTRLRLLSNDMPNWSEAFALRGAAGQAERTEERVNSLGEQIEAATEEWEAASAELEQYMEAASALYERWASTDTETTNVDSENTNVGANTAEVSSSGGVSVNGRTVIVGGAEMTYDAARGKGEYAKGLWSVPYDDYSAILHRGEMVLNASRAREYRENNGGFDPNELYTAVSGAVAEAVGNIQLNMDGSLVGNAVSGTVSRNIYNKANRRRYG